MFFWNGKGGRKFMFTKVTLGLITVSLGVCCIISIRDAIKRKNASDRIQSVVLTIVTVLIGIGTFLTSNPETINIAVPELSELSEENASLQDQVDELEQKVIDKDSQIESKDDELKNLRASLNNNAEFFDYKLYLNDDEISVNTADSIAKINEKLFFSQDVIESITKETVKEDKDNSLIYVGKYPEERVDLLSVASPFDPTDGFALGMDSSYKMRGNTYADGFSLGVYRDDIRSVSFNLEGKYDELTFKVGHVDESGDSNITIIPVLDGKTGDKYTFNLDTDPDVEQSIPLNKTKMLTIQWYGDNDLKYGTYGFTDIKVK